MEWKQEAAREDGGGERQSGWGEGSHGNDHSQRTVVTLIFIYLCTIQFFAEVMYSI